MDKLITNFGAEKVIEFPDKFPLNNLQKDLLIFDLATDLGINSPYLLNFEILLKNSISKLAFIEAVKLLVDKYPYLVYGINNYSQPESATWTNNSNEAKIFEDFQSNIDFSQPLLRILWDSEKSIRFRWHHILLDGIGIATIVNELIRTIFESKKLVKINLDKVYLNTQQKLNLNIKISNDRAKYHRFVIDKEMLDKLIKVSNNQVKNSLFDLISKATKQTYFAVTDVENHPGLPGMFTQFKLINILENGSITDSNMDVEVRSVLNFMFLETHNNYVERVQNKLSEYCKYENEWQLVQTETGIEINYISAINSRVSDSCFERWKFLFIEKINGISDAIIADNEEIDLFEDFDF